MHILIGPNHFGFKTIAETLTATYPDVTVATCDERDQLKEAIAKADVYFGWLSREDFLAATNLRWIQSMSTGVDGFVRIPELKESDVILTNARGVHAACLAEQTFAMIFGFTRGMKAFLEAQQRHEWAGRDVRNNLVELTGSTMGIVGYGTVGHAIAERAHAFGMVTQAVDIFPAAKPDQGTPVGGKDELDNLLRTSDYVVVTVPYTHENRLMIGGAQLALMKPSAILVVVSRGGLVDEEALVEALTTGRLKAAALDVFETEPLPKNSPLWDIDNLIVLPHAAGGSQFEAAAVREIFLENVDRFMRGDFPLRNEVGKQRGY